MADYRCACGGGFGSPCTCGTKTWASTTSIPTSAAGPFMARRPKEATIYAVKLTQVNLPQVVAHILDAGGVVQVPKNRRAFTLDDQWFPVGDWIIEEYLYTAISNTYRRPTDEERVAYDLVSDIKPGDDNWID